ncbi:uncharacterized protein LOC123210997 [Mangifera indica]|uniref:uncharacterized protein LOC123210997 n=1 Tax=Mangifera indica TaxID=29780 RepID=UPI001CF9BA62|nr:uncharacterized protein LOC123210997 [Mangifera indica]
MAAGSLFRLLLGTSLVFSLLLSLDAVPVTRTGNLMHKSQVDQLPVETTRVTIIGRMDVELNDYPGSGANNRHTPRPPMGKGCVDC